MVQFVNPHNGRVHYLYAEQRNRSEKHKHLASVIYWFSQSPDKAFIDRKVTRIDAVPDGLTLKWPDPKGHGSNNRSPYLCKVKAVKIEPAAAE